MMTIGEQAPDFSLTNEDGKTVALSDFKGKKTIVYFYPKDITPGCTLEACSFRDAFDDFLAAGAVVLGISPDDAASHVNFRKRYGLPFHLLSDPEHKVAEAYGAWGEKNMYGVKRMGVLRSTFILDENAVITKVFPKVKPEGHATEVLAAIKG